MCALKLRTESCLGLGKISVPGAGFDAQHQKMVIKVCGYFPKMQYVSQIVYMTLENSFSK